MATTLDVIEYAFANVNRIAIVQLEKVVSHRTVILPQLGASGISAHEVLKFSGFKVLYGPVKAKDVKEFINSGMKATAEMRTVRFSTYDRLVLTPVELVGSFKVSLVLNGWTTVPQYSGLRALGYLLILPSASDFYAMNLNRVVTVRMAVEEAVARNGNKGIGTLLMDPSGMI